ncbi:MAG: Nif3-like dinuclear metal center hexameric protein [Flavobacteriaceae bacterium]|nr:Nif3-like dinuclear metal center hexameric protein [Flavobacteriaceae bacterium]
MKIKDITNYLEKLAPLSQAEDFDNVGLLVGNAQTKVTGILVTLDTLESVVDEAIAQKCNLIISFHPILFKGLKKINEITYVERVITKAIKNDIAIYSMHTALDNAFNGVSGKIADMLGLQNRRILIPKKNTIKKLTTYVPHASADVLRNTLFEAGAGDIGNYSNCSFNIEGKGTFKANTDAKPTLGKKGTLHTEPETLISVTFQSHLEYAILNALFKAHPYEEVAYEIVSLDNFNQNVGMGMVGELQNPKNIKSFLKELQTKFKAKGIRLSKLLDKPIKTVAVLGGSGSFAIAAAKSAKADVYITADLKYHDFFTAENEIVLVDIGHFESEQFTKNLIVDYLTEKFRNFAVVLSKINTNPINYI